MTTKRDMRENAKVSLLETDYQLLKIICEYDTYKTRKLARILQDARFEIEQMLFTLQDLDNAEDKE